MSGKAGSSWTTVATLTLHPGHDRVVAVVKLSDAGSARLVAGPLAIEGAVWAPAALSSAGSLATTVDAGPSVYTLQVKATSGTINVSAGLYAR